MLVSVVGLLRSLSNASPRTTLRCSFGVQGIVIGFWATDRARIWVAAAGFPAQAVHDLEG